MKLKRFLKEPQLLPNVEVSSKQELLELMSNVIAQSSIAQSSKLTTQDILASILKREEQSSTGLGDGFAFPHARFKDLNSIVIVIAHLKTPLTDYKSADGKPVSYACMAIVPESRPSEALQIMSQVATLFSDSAVRANIAKAKDGNEFYQIILASEKLVDEVVTAQAIMRKPFLTLNEDTALRTATLKMSSKRLNTIPVINDKKQIIGEVSTNSLFKLGIPDFFGQLKSVAFIKEFDPFEKYFFDEAHSKVGDIMNVDIPKVSPSTTIMEIVFMLAVKNIPKIYVVDQDDTLLGVVDKTLVLERIINF
ncbi:PTS sugar transporter subunit IIA [Lentisphaerota bacterium WC36G]|nr:PTS sugar transporter subunit IIA [Lentisphaerae bacterium WC36]